MRYKVLFALLVSLALISASVVVNKVVSQPAMPKKYYIVKVYSLKYVKSTIFEAHKKGWKYIETIPEGGAGMGYLVIMEKY